MVVVRRAAVAAMLIAPSVLAAQSAPKVGPARGTVVVVGGGSMGPEIYSRFIEAAGGPDALIIDVPTAGGDSVYNQNAPGTRGWKTRRREKRLRAPHEGQEARRHATRFAAILKKAGGVWFEGGRQFHLVGLLRAARRPSKAFMTCSSAAASSADRRPARRSSATSWCAARRRTTTSSWTTRATRRASRYLRNVGDRPARRRARAPARSRRLDHAEVSGSARHLRGRRHRVGRSSGDTATIIGRNKAFVYGGKDATDPRQAVPHAAIRATATISRRAA